MIFRQLSRVPYFPRVRPIPTFAGPSTFTATVALVAGSATLGSAATFASGTFTAAAALVAGSATLAAAATHTPPNIFTATAALVAGSATLAAVVDVTNPTTAGLVASRATLETTCTFTKPVYTASVGLVAASATIGARIQLPGGPVLVDRVWETTTGTGSSTLSLLGAVAGYQSISDTVDGLVRFWYSLSHRTANEWETGIGYLSGTSLVRALITANSSGTTSALTLTAGTKDVVITPIAATFDNYNHTELPSTVVNVPEDTLFYGTGADGDVTISSGTTTLTRAMNYRNLTVNGGTLYANGYRVHVSETLYLSGGNISANGNAGGSASGATGGTVGSPYSQGEMPAITAGGHGGNGPTGTTGNGASGSAGSGFSLPGAGSGGNGGAGGAGTGTVGGAATAGPTPSAIGTSTIYDWLAARVTEGGGGGSNGATGGGDNASALGGGGGAGGCGGGRLIIIARNVINASGTISANGGAGGNGGTV